LRRDTRADLRQDLPAAALIIRVPVVLKGKKQVPLGSPALEILIALRERRGELVGKQDLMARVWPNAFVESANFTVHMYRFIINIPARGYYFNKSVM
jgi:DNA-binding winged helix-turn-helix (wHTH) protein